MKRLLPGLFITLFFITACAAGENTFPTQKSLTPTPRPGFTREPGPWRIMPLGDSLTEGGYPAGHHSYRGYLETLLHGFGYEFDFVGTQWRLGHNGTDYDHEGHGGFRIGPDESVGAGWPVNIYDRIDYYLKTDPDIILLLIGINDMFPSTARPINPADADQKLAGLVERILELDPDVHIFIASLVPVNLDRTEPWPEYEAVNAMAEQIGTANPNDRIYFVDMNRVLTPIMDSADYADGLHFSESGARKVAQVWFDAIQESKILTTSP
ncbi:GDSL-type esterase/lipase family protein [Chloroflexota bacterium]